MECTRHWRWAGRTTPTRMAGGSPLRRWTNMRRRWRLGLESVRRTCRPFSRTWRIFRPAIWGSWASRMIYFQPSVDLFLDGDGKGSYECVAGTRARACGGRACARGGYRVLVCEVGRALAGQHGNERGLSVGKGGSECVSWRETGSGVFTFLRCVSDGPQSGHLDIHGRAGLLSGSAAQIQYLCAGAARWG